MFFLEILSHVSFNWTAIVDQIQVFYSSEEYDSISGKDIRWSLISSEYPNCQLVKYSDLRPQRRAPAFLIFLFKNHSDMGLSVKLMDDNSVLRKRSLSSQVTDYIGTPMKIDKLSTQVFKRFFVALKQTKRLEGGPGIECRNYPTKKFSSYQECDEEFVYSTMKKHNVMPFWAAKSLQEVTNQT